MRAMYRSFERTGSRGPKRVHIQRPEETMRRPTRVLLTRADPTTPTMWCGTPAWNVTQSQAVELDPWDRLPDGFAWCGSCVGKHADWLGVLTELADRLVRLEERAGKS